MPKTEEVTYPEHEKMSAIQEESNAIGQFLEWLNGTRGLVICQNGVTDERAVRWLDMLDEFEGDRKALEAAAREAGVITKKDTSWWHDIEPKLHKAVHHYEPFEREGFYPAHISITNMLAEYFEIDLKTIDREKQIMLEEHRKKVYGEEPLGV